MTIRLRSPLLTVLLVGSTPIVIAACGDDAATTSGGGGGGGTTTGSGGSDVTSATSSTGDTTSTTSTGVVTASGVGGAGGTGEGGTAGGGGEGTGAGGQGAGGEGGGTVCAPGETIPCYTGADGTLGVGLCTAGTATCADDGSGFEACVGDVTPRDETCLTAGDDDCDGAVNEEGEGCDCVPGTISECYSGPPATEGVGPCVGGQQVCAESGQGYGPCEGEVLPGAESCLTEADDDCDGAVNEEGEGCLCIPGSVRDCYDGPAGTAGVGLCVSGSETCNAAGTGYGACVGAVLPATESCLSGGDEDCDGAANEEGEGCGCVPGTVVDCYSGPPATEGIGACMAGEQTCLPSGVAFGPCEGEVTPTAETCNGPDDEDCDGAINEGGEGCVCQPGSTALCYTGPAGTLGVGLCSAGTVTCNAQGTGYGACQGEVLPAAETCETIGDEDCDGLANEEGSACQCVPGTSRGCYSGPPGTEGVGPCQGGMQTCTPDGMGFGACSGEVTPVAEACNTATDDDCDGAPNDGCGVTRWSEGTYAWPDQACNPTNSFGYCNTNAQNHADAWATAVCTNNGYTSGIWTGQKIAGCSGNISMWCQGNIPCTPLYETQCAPGDQTRIEVTCF